MSWLERVKMAGSAALSAYRGYSSAMQPMTDRERYDLLHAFYGGQWRSEAKRRGTSPQGRSLYRNTRQLVKQTDAIISLYEIFVYAGDLSTDGQPLPDGTRGAIPIDPQTGSETTDQQLQTAFSELFKMWQWRGQMSEAPKWSAVLGDCLTELVDDYPRGVVMPRLVDPRWVPAADLELDDVGNVKRYALEYPVTIEASTAFGRTVKGESYLYRKEVDSDTFRYYRDGKPYDFGGGSEQENPYGFCPAVWSRHERIIGSNRGRSAIEKILYQAMEVNSLLSSALDYQMKQFAAPVGVIGSSLDARLRRGGTLTMPSGASGETVTADDVEELRRAAAENLNLIAMGQGGEFVTVQFDVGKTTEMAAQLLEGLYGEAPEAEYGKKLTELSQATGPGLDRILSPITGEVKDARKQHDPNTVKLLQMGTTMMGYRLNAGDFPADLVAARTGRYEAFQPFRLETFDRGLMDCSIPDRPVFEASPDEKMQTLVLTAQIVETGDPWLMAQAGVPDEEITRILADRAARQEAREAALERRFNAGLDSPDDDEAA